VRLLDGHWLAKRKARLGLPLVVAIIAVAVLLLPKIYTATARCFRPAEGLPRRSRNTRWDTRLARAPLGLHLASGSGISASAY
jgi:hypothetical protein